MAIRNLIIFVFLVLQTSAAAAATAQPSDTFQTPAIDQDLFREGEVRHLRGVYKEWQSACDEVPRLKQRFCSLYGKGRDSRGRILLGIVVTTSDEGKPAAMLEMPLGIRVSSDVEVLIGGPGSVKKMKGPAKDDTLTRLRIVRCDINFCMTLWQLTPSQIAALSGHGALRIFFKVPRARFGWTTLSSPSADQMVEASIASDGFRETLLATQAP